MPENTPKTPGNHRVTGDYERDSGWASEQERLLAKISNQLEDIRTIARRAEQGAAEFVPVVRNLANRAKGRLASRWGGLS